jgi:hypothetical protein
MTHNCIDCNLAAKLTSQTRRKLGQNRGELASHRFVACLSSFERHFVTITLHVICHSYLLCPLPNCANQSCFYGVPTMY